LSATQSSSDCSIELRYRCSSEFIPILQHLRASIVVSTYKLGKVAVIQASGSALDVRLTSFPTAMGLAIHPRKITVGTRRGLWTLAAERDIPWEASSSTGPSSNSKSLTLAARDYHITGNISIHELAYHGDTLWGVNTLFSCLCTFETLHNFVPKWKPWFISELRPEDRCHLNGMAMDDDGPRYVTALGQTDVGGGWRENKIDSGCLIDVRNNRIVASGLCMPHSPRLHDSKLFVLNSGCGELCVFDETDGHVDPIDAVPGYTRGLSIAGQFAFVGMSQIRESNVFGGLPIAKKHDALRCGVAVVDLISGRSVAWFEFETAVEEIFAVEVLCNAAPTRIHSPDLEEDDQELWIVPPLKAPSATD